MTPAPVANQRQGETWQGMKFCTYNAHGIASTGRLVGLEEALCKINFDLIGLSETHHFEAQHDVLQPSGWHFYNSGKPKADGASSRNYTYTGVGFIISQKLHHHFAGIRYISDRIIQVDFKFRGGRTIQVTQVYAPHSGYSDADYDEFLNQLSDAISNSKHSDQLIMGDFNARIGQDGGNERHCGKHCTGRRNTRGDALAAFCEDNDLYVANGFFKKPTSRRWTWRNKNGSGQKEEIDYVLTRRRTTVTDVQVLSRFDAGSDHRLVRAVIRTPLFRWQPRTRPQLHAGYNQLKLKAKLVELMDQPTPSDSSTIEQWRRLRSALTQAAHEAELHTERLRKISDRTKQLNEERLTRKHGTGPQRWALIDYTQLCKLYRMSLAEDLKKHRVNVMKRAIRTNRWRSGKLELMHRKKAIAQLKRPDGTLTTRTGELAEQVSSFYNALYSSSDGPFIFDARGPLSRPITGQELRNAAAKIRGNKAPGIDGIRSRAAKYGTEVFADELASTVNKMFEENEVPADFAYASTILLYKKGDHTDLGNYRPISLLPTLYKVVTRVLAQRVEEVAQARLSSEQAGFRQTFSTIDHIHAINMLLEKTHEFNQPIYLMFIDFRKAFDTIEFRTIWQALEHFGVDECTVRLIKHLYSSGTAAVQLEGFKANYDVQRGVRQGDSLSPLIFTLCLQHAMEQVKWDDDAGIDINGRRLRHLDYADDIVIIATTPQKLQRSTDAVVSSITPTGLQVNASKTKWMANERGAANAATAAITINGETIERVTSFVYLGQLVHERRNHAKEIGRRTGSAWATFNKAKDLLCSKNTPQHLKRRYFQMCIMPSLLYGCETWALTEATWTRLARVQRSMERRMLGLRLRDKKASSWIRAKTKLPDVVIAARKRQWKFAGRIYSTLNPPFSERWTVLMTRWVPNTKRNLGRPCQRWEDDIRKHTGTRLWSRDQRWTGLAQNAKRWKSLERTYAKPAKMPPRRSSAQPIVHTT
jgi:hypothetical protein